METLPLARHEAGAWKLAQIDPEAIAIEEANEVRQQVNVSQVPTGRWKCQTDASWTEQGDGTGLGFTLLEGAVEIVTGRRKVRQANSPLQAEVECLAWQWRYYGVAVLNTYVLNSIANN